jgi:alkylation response protein AidB-like acyl-CoA dehydrogenase
VSLDLAFDDGQQAIADSVAQFCAERFDDDAVKASAGRLPRDAWQALAGLGVLGVLTPEGGGGVLEAVAAIESLGGAVFPGPLAATFLATRILSEPERTDVAEGRSIVSVGAGELWPWAPEADLVLEITGEEIHRVRLLAAPEPLDTLGGEPWGRAEVERGEAVPDSRAGLCVYRTLIAAQLAAMGERLVRDASRHAAIRKQFGRPIGDFQAVAHPLADASMRLSSSSTLAHAAAWHCDEGRQGDAVRLSAAAHLSACAAAIDAVHVGHQVFGAIGITLEGPVFHVSRRVRQLASLPPGADASRALLRSAAHPESSS